MLTFIFVFISILRGEALATSPAAVIESKELEAEKLVALLDGQLKGPALPYTSKAKIAGELAKAHSYAYAFPGKKLFAYRYGENWLASGPSRTDYSKTNREYSGNYPLSWSDEEKEARKRSKLQEHWLKAVELYRNLEKHPQYSYGAQLRLAWLFHLAGKKMEAVEWYRKAISDGKIGLREKTIGSEKVPLFPVSHSVKVLTGVEGNPKQIEFEHLMLSLPLKGILDSSDGNLGSAISKATRQKIELRINEIEEDLVVRSEDAIKKMLLLADEIYLAYDEAHKSGIFMVSDRCETYSKVLWNADVTYWALNNGKRREDSESFFKKIINLADRYLRVFNRCGYSSGNYFRNSLQTEATLSFYYSMLGSKMVFKTGNIYPTPISPHELEDQDFKSLVGREGMPRIENLYLTLDRAGSVVSRRKDIFPRKKNSSEIGPTPEDFTIEKTLREFPSNEGALNFIKILDPVSDAGEIERIRRGAFEMFKVRMDSGLSGGPGEDVL